MAKELLSNLPEVSSVTAISTLKAELKKGETTFELEVGLPARFETAGTQSRIVIGHEILLVTKVEGSGKKLTVTRNVGENSKEEDHPIHSNVFNFVPREAIEAYVAENPVRAEATFKTASIANGALEEGTITLAKGYRLLRVSVDKGARVRLYTSTVHQAADKSRAYTEDPKGNHGLVYEGVFTTELLTLDCAPGVTASDLDASVTNAIPITVTNESGSTGTVTVTITYQQTE